MGPGKLEGDMEINGLTKKHAIGLAFAFGVLLSAPASAATFTSCTSIVDPVYDISTKVSGAVDCTLSNETDNDSETVVNADLGFFDITNWILGGKLGDNGDPGYEGTGTEVDDDTGQIGGQSGTYDFSAAFETTWDEIMLVFKDGNGTTLVGYLLNNGVLSGSWATPFLNPPFSAPGNGSKDVSHISVYYTECPPGRFCGIPVGEVPLPAGILLLISALGGLGFLARFRKTGAAA
jgi:hypothetical protein